MASIMCDLTSHRAQIVSERIVNIVSWRREYKEIRYGDLGGHSLGLPLRVFLPETVYIPLHLLAWYLLKIN
jgi:uncharacterized membrane protein YecN with MAPEG domain